MLNVLAGRLGHDVNVINNNGKEYCYATIFTWPGDKRYGDSVIKKDAIPVKVYARNEQAQELAKYGKGDTIQFIGKVENMEFQGKSVIGFEIKSIDHEKKILKEMNEILNDYIKNEIKQRNQQHEMSKSSLPKEIPLV